MADSLDVDVELSVADSMQSASQQVADDEVDVAIVVGGQPTVIAKQDRADSFVATAQQVVGVQALAGLLEEKGLSAEEVGQALQDSTAKVVRLDQDGRAARRRPPSSSTLLYILLLMLMIQVANGVAIEKANRISEVLLAIVRPGPAAVRQGDRRRAGRHRHPGRRRAAAAGAAAAGGDLPAGLGAAIAAGGRGSCSASSST